MINTLFYESADLHFFPATNRSQFLNAGNFLSESDTSRAMYAPRHVCGDQRTEVLVGNGTFALRITGYAPAITHREVLQFTLPALITNRAIQRMVN